MSTPLMDDRLLSEFLAEAEDLVDDLYRDLAALRGARGEGRARRELVGRIFRHVHTLKGSAAAAGVEVTGALAHDFESLLDAVRGGRVAVGEEALAAFDEALDAIAADLGAAARGASSAPPAGLAERLRRLAAPGARPAGGAQTAAEASLPAEVARTLTEYERQRAREAAREGAGLFVVEVSFGLADFDEQFRRLGESLSERGEVVSAQPGVAAGHPDRVSFRIVHATQETREELAERVAGFGATLLEAGGAAAPAGDETVAPSPTPESVAEPAQFSPEHPPGPAAMQVRVTLEELDELISAAHGLAAETAGALGLALEGGPGGEALAELEERAPRIRQSFYELEERLIGLRMVPARAALERAARAGQSVARAAGKAVDFEIEGGEARLDRSLAERVAVPLLHLLRNAIDHGVETAAERRAAGKPARGLVRIEAEAEAGRVALRVSDDGRGVDLERVARAARERGIVAPDANVTEQQALRLIFRPGFSTAGRATAVSGRGVGLDAVERAVEQAGGELRVRSERGRGTTFEMRLPATVALLPALLVRAGRHRYCLDARHVVEARVAAREDLFGEDGGARSVAVRGERLPLFELRALLGLPADGEPEGPRVSLVVARAPGRRDEGADARVAVVVDEVEGRGEFLVRGLGRHGARWRGVSGATELRDGAVALVLDLPRLLDA
ncbi:MAG TPA: ATP-binding protein [Pyrinomonadaceae bacterium]|nr:ATP-binding protein [Pyrinomonadaceae bacterium]